MVRLIGILAVTLFSVSIVAETVYKSTKPDGSVEFTDQASPDSEEVKVRKPTTYTAPSLPRLTLPAKKLSPSFNYELVITKPVNDSTILNKADVSVSIELTPALRTAYGHKVLYKLGSREIKSQSNNVTFNNVDRGSHTINISIVDSKGETVSTVASTTFHLKRFFKKSTPPPKPKTP